MAKPSKISAFAYLRTSSAANIGEDKDSGHRQLAAIQSYAKRAVIELAGTYHDEAVKGSDPIDARPGFAAMLEAIEGNGTRTIIVESASRFARDLIVQEVGFAMLKDRGIDLIAADNPSSFLDDTPTTRLIRQMLGAFAEFEKAMLVAKLKGARDRKRRRLAATYNGRKPVKVEGRKSIAEKRPETVARAKEIAKELRRALPKGRKPSLRDLSVALAAAGHTTPSGLPYSPSAVARMLDSDPMILERLKENR